MVVGESERDGERACTEGYTGARTRARANGREPRGKREKERERVGRSPPLPNTVGVNIKHSYCFPSLYVFVAAGFNGNSVLLWSV